MIKTKDSELRVEDSNLSSMVIIEDEKPDPPFSPRRKPPKLDKLMQKSQKEIKTNLKKSMDISQSSTNLFAK